MPAREARLCALLLTLSLAAAGSPSPAGARTASRRTRRDDELAGRVVDSAGAPIEGARVQLVELGLAVLTADDGGFALAGVAPGRYTLEVRRPGFRTASVPVSVPGMDALVVELEASAFALDPLQVTVARGPLDPGASPLPTSSLGAQTLERDRSVSLSHTLSALPGVRTLSTGGEIGKPVVRGLAGARVLVLADGLRLEDYSWSDEDGPAVDPTLVDRVEVVRGPASVLYGADAVGGVVNVISRPLPEAAGTSVVRGDAELSAASNNREGGLTLRGEGASGPWGWRAAASGRFAEALHTPAGELENTGFGAFSGEAAAMRRGDWGTLTARFVQNGGEFKLLEEEGPPAGVQEGEEKGPERKLSDQRLQLLGNFPLEGGRRLETRLQLQRHNIIEMEDDPEAMARGELVEVAVYDLTLSTLVGEALLHHSLASGTSGTVGVTGTLQHSRTGGVIPIVPGADEKAAGVFLLERARVDALTLLGGLRAEAASVNPTGHADRSLGAFTWSAGGALRVAEGLSLTANAGTAWRAPTLFELYASGPRLGEARYEIGRDDLGEERSLNLDVGARVDLPRVRAQVAAYRNDFRRFLYIQPTGEVRDGYQVYRYQQADALLTGAEGSVELEATGWLSFSAKGELVRGTNQGADEPLPLMPPKRFVYGVELHDARSYLGAEVEAVAKPGRLNRLDYPVGAHTLLHFTAGVRGTWHGREAGLDLKVRNAGNTRYRDFLSRYKAFALDPGRDVVLRLRMAL